MTQGRPRLKCHWLDLVAQAASESQAHEATAGETANSKLLLNLEKRQ
jgi:hypothetical protein